MATTTNRKRKSPATRKGKQPAARKQGGKRAPAKAPTGPPPIDADRIREMWGVGLGVLAILSGLGLWIQDSAGLVGVVLVNVFRGLFGVFGLVVPLLIAAGGVLLLREPRPRNSRIVIGTGVILLAVMGLWHLVSGTPGPDAARIDLHDASGWIGMAMSLPLKAVAAVPGALVVLVGLLILGVLILTATPLRVAVGAIVSVFVSDAPSQSWWSRRGDQADYVEDFGHEDGAHEDGSAESDAPRAKSRRSRAAKAESAPIDSIQPSPAGAMSDGAAAPQALTIELDSDQDQGGQVEAGQVEHTLVDPHRADTVVMDRSAADAAEFADLAGEDDGDAGPEFITYGGGRGPGDARQLVQNPDVDYVLPSPDLLRSGRAANGNSRAMEQMTQALETMLTEFGVDARVVAVRRGPTVTRFEIELGTGVKVAAITKLEKDISYALATPEIRIVAPIPGKVAIGIEVPNTERDHITLGDILRSPEAAAQTHPLTAGIGVDISGRPVTINLAKMPHLLIAGATGSGKSVVMNSIVTSVIMRNTPDEVRMILIDPKRVEMTTYEDVPHLLTRVVTDPKRAKDALDWLVAEMERRYDILARYGFRNLDRFNEAVVSGELRDIPVMEQDPEDLVAEAAGDQPPGQEAMPYILCVIDELADLMMVAPRDIEGAIVRIAQMARAVGIHLIIATQRPSVNVVTGLIKANVPSRIALSMATGHDSKTILDQHGAEKLIGMGDMLYMPANASKPHRLQGCYLDEVEIEQIVDHCKAQSEVTYAENVVKKGQEAVLADVKGDDATDEDLTRAAMELVVRSGLGSTSMLQRKLKVGFARAGRLMDELETAGIVGPSEGPKARTVLMTVEQLEEHRSASV